MSVLVFEFMVGGGVADQHPLDEDQNKFLKQGHAMLNAVCEDLLELGHEVVTLVDNSVSLELPEKVERIPITSERDVDAALLGAAIDAEYILLVAPECGGILEHYISLLFSFANRLISPGAAFVKLASNKWECHQWLTKRGVPCPDSMLLKSGSDVDEIPHSFFPGVAKPIDGAGSEGVNLVSATQELERSSCPILFQQFVEGIPASVSAVSQFGGTMHFLEPGRQVFDAEPFGVHLRTEFPLDKSLRRRALDLARKTVAALPETRGYFGIDMVLGEDPSKDFVIEVNPRLTTSYFWLRKWNRENISKLFPL